MKFIHEFSKFGDHRIIHVDSGAKSEFVPYEYIARLEVDGKTYIAVSDVLIPKSGVVFELVPQETETKEEKFGTPLK